MENTKAAGQQLAPQLWAERYGDYLYAYAMLRLGNGEQAKDLVQETFLAALERMDAFEGRSNERTWLTAILKHKIFDVYRKRKTIMLDGGAKQEEEVPDFFNAEDGHWNDAHRPALLGIEENNGLENKEFRRILEACMQKLPALWLAVFTMKHIDDESTASICQELKVTQSSFWVSMHRAKVSLRSCLQKNWV